MKKLNSLNFNLREPRAKKATQLYAVIRVDGKQYKIPLQCKIQPWLWNSRKQIPISNGDTNALHIFNIISHLRLLFEKNVYMFAMLTLSLN